MSIRDIEIKLSYAGKGSVILKEFLLPAINEAVKYDRITSFYTVESLLAISQGIQSMYEKSGKMRLIIGIHSFPPELVEAELQKNFLINQIKKIRQDIIDGILCIQDALERERLATLAWMIQDDLIEVKAAAMNGDGIFHPKTLILTDENDNTIVAVGSPNETSSGLGGNFEQIMVAKSWDSPEAVNVQKEFFDSLWNNLEPDATIIEVSDQTARMILDALGNEYKNHNKKSKKIISCDGLIKQASKMPANFFVSGNIPSLYMHQERAVIDALSRWPVRVLFSDEVGLGKTFEVAATMTYLIKYCGVNRVVILTPKSVLHQWQEELKEHFEIDAWLFDSSTKTYSSFSETLYIGAENPLGKKSPNIILMSVQYARGSGKNKNVFNKKDTVLPDLLILDEAHSARVSKNLAGGTKATKIYTMLDELKREIPHLILATATPMQKDANEYHAMLKLLGLPKGWQKTRNYQTSLKLISNKEIPDSSDSYCAGFLVQQIVNEMKPDLKRFTNKEKDILSGLLKIDGTKQYELGCYVQEKWDILKNIFIKLHPAHLLTIRNTRRSLEQVGYKFPKRNLHEVSIDNSIQIHLFYERVSDYLSRDCFSVERELFPDRKISLGFVRVSYQQRVASSLFSCKKSLEHRYYKLMELKQKINDQANDDSSSQNFFSNNLLLDDIDIDDWTNNGNDEDLNDDRAVIDFRALKRAIGIETTALSSLIHKAENLLGSCGDLKIQESIRLAIECMDSNDTILLFSRYTDTIDSLINEFKRIGADKKYVYGIYTGQKSLIVDSCEQKECDKATIKKELFSGHVKIMFCSDAASEGLNLQAARVLINVDVPWTPARLEQRIGRIARLGQLADEVDVYNVWYPYSIEARMYHRIQKRLDEANIAVGEFPEILANNIKQAVLENREEDNEDIESLNQIRNSFQITALETLWNKKDDKVTSSTFIRNKLIDICKNAFEYTKNPYYKNIQMFCMPDGKIESLTAIDGMSESISLKSCPWKFFDYKCKEINVLTDDNKNEIAFVKAGSDEILKHENVFKLVLGEKLDSSDFLKDYPKMLPDNRMLNLAFSIDCELTDRPSIWPDFKDEK